MPGLTVFGRRWQIGSDDFVFPSFIELFIRLTWLISSAIIFMRHNSKLDCSGGDYLKIYFYGNFLILLSINFSLIALLQNSMSGFIMDQESRKYVSHSLYFRIALEIPEIVWNSLGTYWVFAVAENCTEVDVVIIVKIMTICNWVFILLMIISIAVVFDPLGSTSISYEEEAYEHRIFRNSKTARIWERRCKFLMCSCIQRNDELSKSAFKDIGKIMGFLFADIDLVPSDIAAGMILLHIKNMNEANELRTIHELETSGQSSYSVTTMRENDSWNSPELITHFMKFALGSYGWPWFLVANFKCGICKLWQNLLCCGCCIKHPCSIEGDNCCYCNFSALKHTTHIEQEDLIYATFHNDLFQTPFYVVVDHKTQSIIIAIRGTLSLRDTITDLTAEAKDFELDNIPPGSKAHGGMMLCAKNVLEKLNSLGLLERSTSTYPNYGLVLTGHSLGAGTAAILSILLHSKYPNLKCFAFSPPGGLMTQPAAIYSETFTTSIILGDDIIGRISVPSFEVFKSQLVSILKSCRTPKYQILVGGCLYFLIGGKPKISYQNQQNFEDDGSESNLNLLAQTEQQPNYQTYVSLAEVSYRLQRESVTREILYPPGKILHITERPIFNSRPDLNDGPRFESHWAKREDFREIKVTPKMMVHHYPDQVYFALQDIATYSSITTNRSAVI